MKICYPPFAALLALTCYGQVPAKQNTVVVISLDGFPAYALEDPQLPVPTLRRLIHEGAWAQRMTPVNPTVTWPNHTSMVTGVLPAKHGLFYNGSAVRTGGNIPVKVDPEIAKTEMVHATTVYDIANRAGLTTAQVDWVAINRAPTITWEFPEVPSVSGAIEKEMVAQGILAQEEVAQFKKLNIQRRDQIWTEAASYILREHHPNLLLFHLLTLDSTHHAYGPRNAAALGAIAFLDGCVARILETIQQSGAQDRTTVFVVSDHGFKAVDKTIRPAAVLQAAGLIDKVSVIPEGGTAMLYFDRANRAALQSQVAKVFEGVEGIERIAGPKEYAALGFPDPASNEQMSDLVLIAKAGYAFAGGTTGPAFSPGTHITGSHGYVATDPEMDAIFIASGRGIRKGAVLDRVPNLDIAPTVAGLLGLTWPDTPGKAISAILSQ